MRSIKPGRGPSAMGAAGSIAAIVFGSGRNRRMSGSRPAPRAEGTDQAAGYCPYCGTALKAEFAFCPKCGKPLEQSR